MKYCKCVLMHQDGAVCEAHIAYYVSKWDKESEEACSAMQALTGSLTTATETLAHAALESLDRPVIDLVCDEFGHWRTARVFRLAQSHPNVAVLLSVRKSSSYADISSAMSASDVEAIVGAMDVHASTLLWRPYWYDCEHPSDTDLDDG